MILLHHSRYVSEDVHYTAVVWNNQTLVTGAQVN